MNESVQSDMMNPHVDSPSRKEIILTGFGGQGILLAGQILGKAASLIDLKESTLTRQQFQLRNDRRAGSSDNPSLAKTTTTLLGNPETPFNLPLLAYAAGATYVARWTILHTRDLTKSIEEALLRRGFSFIEILAPCPTGYGRRNREKPLETLQIYRDRTIVKNGAHPSEVILDFGRGITLGTFVDQERPTCTEMYDRTCRPSFDDGA